MKLSDLNIYHTITIQCHDNPDADSIASGYGIYEYFRWIGKSVRLIYSGENQIQKSNLVIMIDKLNIPIDYVKELEEVELLVLVDCQYGAGNVTRFPGRNIAMIDHHQLENTLSPLNEIQTKLGSCSTIVWHMLLEEHFPVNDYKNLATALYYGLLSDTNNFSEIYHPADKDMRDSLKADFSLITQLKNSNLSLSELEIAGIALLRYTYHEENRFAIIKAQPCDPNILGLISDLVQQVDSIDTCIVYSELNNGIKLSIRSCIKEVKACELAEYLTDPIGSGGGHFEKAGGFIPRNKFMQSYSNITTEQFLLNRLTDYYHKHEVLYAETAYLDLNEMNKYEKLPIPIGYVKASDLLNNNTPIMIRTIKGDMELLAHEHLYIMIGIQGEVTLLYHDQFMKKYSFSNEAFSPKTPYLPILKNRITGEVLELMDFVQSCVPTGRTFVYAKQLEKATKVFTIGDSNIYQHGAIGDYLVAPCDNLKELSVIEQDMFALSYKQISQTMNS